MELEKAAFSGGALKKRGKELIAIGISVRINCESCMQWHIEQAAAAGASYDEVLEVVEVGIEMGAAPPRYPRVLRCRSWKKYMNFIDATQSPGVPRFRAGCPDIHQVTRTTGREAAKYLMAKCGFSI
ncbi:MAG: carboxymuconolactone decarboxylase family protein [Desulfobacteraceae bacterium]|nr:carboxymuconolactone decarboxylase family protein [Desulfobacteraceae bacterium]